MRKTLSHIVKIGWVHGIVFIPENMVQKKKGKTERTNNLSLFQLPSIPFKIFIGWTQSKSS